MEDENKRKAGVINIERQIALWELILRKGGCSEAQIADMRERLDQRILNIALPPIDTARMEKWRESMRQEARDAARYRWLRDRDPDTIFAGGVFAGKAPENFVLSGIQLDAAIDGAMAAELPDASDVAAVGK
ncbi:hypothetical protein [Rhodopseudomonas parapalustris]